MSKNIFDNALKLAAKYPNTFQLPNASMLTKIKVGDNVKVGFTASRCHLFDKDKQAFK